GVFTLQGKVDIASASQKNVFRNVGHVIKSGGSTSTISSALYNAGVVEVAAGRLTITGDVSGAGTLQIDAGQALEIDGAVASQQTVAFGSGNQRLLLNDAIAFSGRVANFAAGDRLDFTRFDSTSTTLGFAEHPN